MKVREDYNHLFESSVSQWTDIYARLNKLDPNEASYILITAPLPFDKVTPKHLKGLSSIPWCCVVDFDTNSSKGGLLHTFSHHQSSKLQCECKTYLDLQGIRFDNSFSSAIEKLSLGLKSLWFLPHGDVDNETDKYCPLSDQDKYAQEVRCHLNDTLRFIIRRLNSERPTFVLFLCFGNYAIDGKHFPPFFHDALGYLYQSVVENLGEKNVLFFTDRATPLGKISCCHMPLTNLCDHFYQTCNKLMYNVPMILPSITGSLKVEGSRNLMVEEAGEIDVVAILESFILLHRNIHEEEYANWRQVKLKTENLQKEELDVIIEEEPTTSFLRGSHISWIGLNQQMDIKRDLVDEIHDKIKGMASHENLNVNARIFELFHETGAGASTLARRVLWDLRERYICLILRENYCYAEETASHLVKLYSKFNCPILLLIDEDLPQYHTDQLMSEVTAETVPFILLKVTRVVVSTSFMSSKTSSYLALN